MTETQNVLEKNFDIWFVNKSSPTVIASPTGAVVSAPAEKVTVTCTADLICKAVLTSSSDGEPVKAMLDWFKLTQIPDTMAIKAFPKGKALLTKWFNANAYTMTINEKHGEDLYSHPELIDNTTITMEWLQSYSRVREAISKLRDVDYLMRAKDPLRNTLKNAGLLDGQPHTIIPWNGQLISDSFHKNWQFQLVKIDTSFNDQMERYLAGPDDLYAALGAFEMAAAIAEVMVTPRSGNGYLVTIPRIVIYARDTYDFNDDKGGSQYLGHWNHHDLDISLGAYLNNQDDSPLVHYSGDKPTKENTYFCVRNKHFRKWREKSGKGGECWFFQMDNRSSLHPVRYLREHKRHICSLLYRLS